MLFADDGKTGMSDRGCGQNTQDHQHMTPAAGCTSAACCSGGVPVFDGVDRRYKRVLWTVIGINGAMFFAEMVAGHVAGSQALKADALDFLADTVTYALSLAVIGASLKTRAMAALSKGISLSAMSLWVFGSTLYQTLVLGIPRAELMGAIGLLALAANFVSVLLLMRYKDGDANIRSVWLCSRNDAIGNIVVLIAALAVFGTESAWPDLAVAGVMAGIFLTSSVQILKQAWREYRGAPPEGAALKPPVIRRSPARQ
jgi:Co/Zn/Cd efflux system component